MNQQLLNYVERIKQGARINNQRTGQYLFNHLPPGAANSVRATLIDPFHKQMTDHELYMWLDEHVIFDRGWIIATFNNNVILWEHALD